MDFVLVFLLEMQLCRLCFCWFFLIIIIIIIETQYSAFLNIQRRLQFSCAGGGVSYRAGKRDLILWVSKQSPTVLLEGSC